MSFDGMVLKAVIEELKRLTGGRVGKIYQPEPMGLVLHIRSSGITERLYLSAHPNFARMQLTKEQSDNPKEPPMFCMLLRKHLEGSKIKAIYQHDLERIATIDFKTTNELGDTVYRQLVIEIMGRHSNIILLEKENQMILGSIKHIPPGINRYRTILPGRTYVAPPPQNKLNPLFVDEQTLLKKLDFNVGKLDEQLVKAFSGLSPLMAKEMIHRANLANRENVTKAFFAVQKQINEKQYTPQIKTNEKGKEFFSIISLTHINGHAKTFPTISKLLDQFFFQKAVRDRVHGQAKTLEKWLQNEHNKNKRKIKKLQQTLRDAERAKQYRLFGELLTAHLHEVNRGDKQIEVVNYYDENSGKIIIPLDQKKTPSENAQAYFRKYSKSKNAVAIVQTEIQKAKQEINYFNQLLQQISSASPKDIDEIREELAEEGYLKIRNTRKKTKKPAKPVPEVYHSSENIEILVGKNNKQNEYLTTRLAHANDTWLHTKDIPGSHVVIRSQQFGEATLKEAANLAAYFSKSKNSSTVPVDYTKIRHVRKPGGAKPGYVIYDHQQTLYVTPDEEWARSLKK